jgi:hypothetical protein
MDGVELDDFRLRLRVSEIYQNYRYAKKTQLSLDLKKYRYVGEIHKNLSTEIVGFFAINHKFCLIRSEHKIWAIKI